MKNVCFVYDKKMITRKLQEVFLMCENVENQMD